jgi:hypothetical protein
MKKLPRFPGVTGVTSNLVLHSVKENHGRSCRSVFVDMRFELREQLDGDEWEGIFLVQDYASATDVRAIIA